MANIGSAALVGANARIGKIGGEAYGGGGSEEGGTVLYDGTVTLEEMDGTLVAFVAFASPLVEGKTYTLTCENGTFVGECLFDEEENTYYAELEETQYTGRNFILNQTDENQWIEYGDRETSAGEMAIKIVQA